MESSRERDQSIERLLRQSRPSLQAPQDGGMTDSCLDAETLAAWADGGMSGAALEVARTHVADCARCQSLVGALARINSVVPPVEPERAGRRWLAWLVPLTAAAAAVALWVAVPRDQSERAARLPQATEIQRQAAETKAKEPALPAGQPQAAASGNKAEQPLRTLVPSEAAKKDGRAQELRRDAARSEADSLSIQSAPSSVVTPSASALSAPAAPAAAEPSRRSANVLDSAGSAKLRAETGGIEIVSPDPMVRWRIAGPVVQRSTNGGASWDDTPTGVTAELTAGAAPSASVCWAVGRGGVVLLWADGRRWRRVALPIATDLSGVRARDARTASVSTADGRTFSTTDGGVTWVPRPLQDF